VKKVRKILRRLKRKTKVDKCKKGRYGKDVNEKTFRNRGKRRR
jgi:hypothetical protein